MADTIPVTVYLDPQVKNQIDALRTSGFSLTGFIRAAIDEKLTRFSTQPNPAELARLISRS